MSKENFEVLNFKTIFKWFYYSPDFWEGGPHPGPLPILIGRGDVENEISAIMVLMAKVRRNIQNPLLRPRARELRHEQTPSEQKLWQVLRNRAVGGLKFRRQAPFGSYIVDFYCAEAKLVVEVDGDVHESQVEYDAERTCWLESIGLKVMRVRNEDVMFRLEAVLDEIWNEIDQIE